MSGRRQTSRLNRRGLIGAARRQRSWGPIDLLIRQIQPGRTFMVLVALGLAIGAVFTDLLWPWWVWLAVAVIQVLFPLVFLARERDPARYLLKYPLLVVFGLLWLPVRVTSARVQGWYHTPHS